MSLAPVEQITHEDAERLSNRIGLRLDSMADNWAGALPLIREAIEREAFRPLGYASHGAYVADRFGDSLAKLGVELRREIVRELTDAGLSTRAIAPVLGVSQMTVVRDIAPETNVSPEPTDVPDLPVNPQTGEVYEAGDTSPQTITETHTVKIVTGLDGKEYKTTPKEPRRSSLVEDARNAGWQLRKAVERLERLEADDRFTKNKAETWAALQPHLDLAEETLARLRESLT